MRLTERSYPFPVIGNRDDVPGADFQATVEPSADAEMVYIDVIVSTSSISLKRLLDDGRATYVVHVECGNTSYRASHAFREEQCRVAVEKANLNDAVEVNVIATAREEVPGYRVDGQNEEYGDHTFTVRPGDILAVNPGVQFYVERDFLSFEKIDSILVVLPYSDERARPMEVTFDDEKIKVYLSKQDFYDYKLVRSSPLAPILAASIVLPVVAEAVRYAKDNSSLTLRWMRALNRRLEILGVTMDDEPLTIAQALLELPIRRAISAAVNFQSEL